MPFLKIREIKTRKFMLKIFNKNSLVFVFFLILSFASWVALELNDEYEQNIKVAVKLVNVPSNVVILTPPQDINVTIRDKGVNIIKYPRIETLTIDFNDYSNSYNGFVEIPVKNLVKQLIAIIPSTATVVSYQSDFIDYYFNYGLNKKVPVKLQGNIQTDEVHSILDIEFVPKYVTVYASQNILDTISAIYTHNLEITDLSEDIVKEVRLNQIRGVRISPEKVRVNINVEQMIEKKLEVPIQHVNFPADKTIHTFPNKVTVKFQVSSELYNEIKPEDFIIVINYEDIINMNDSKIHLELKSMPNGVSHCRIIPEEIEYLIEEIQ